jgi:hypothetical protein
MSIIIAGNVLKPDAVQSTLAALMRAGFATDQTTTFFINPPGLHVGSLRGGEEVRSRASQNAAGDAAFPAAVGNADNRINPETPAARDALRRREPSRKTGLMIATAAAASRDEAAAVRILRAHGAVDIERAEGTIAAGEWTDFNPLTPPKLVVV